MCIRDRVNKERALRARPDQTHIPGQNAVQLRQLVDPYLADESTDTGHPIVIGRCPARQPVTLGVVAHAAKLDDLEQTAIKANAFLAIEDWKAVFENDHHRRDQHHGQGEQQQERRHDDVEQALDASTPPTLPKTLAKNQPAHLSLIHI